MKKKIISMIMAMVLMVMAAGCTTADDYNEVKKLEESLGKKVKEYARTGFGTEINFKDFDIAMGVEVEEDQFESVKSVEGLKEVYYTGYVKGEPEDVLNFVLVYDVENDKLVKFGIQTMDDDEMVYKEEF